MGRLSTKIIPNGPSPGTVKSLLTFVDSSFTNFQDVRVPVQLQRAMAAEAEAAREARAKVVAAEGEQKASVHLKEAAVVLEQSNSALQLRYLQVLSFWIPAQCLELFF